MPQPTIKFRGRIENARICLEPPGKEQLAALIQRLEGKEISLTLKRWAENRSSSANKYYWGVVLAVFAEELGYEPENLHHELKRKFLAVDPDAPLIQVRSTADLSTQEFAEYIDRVVRFAAEWGCVIPDAEMVA